jgi:hypothetical protein
LSGNGVDNADSDNGVAGVVGVAGLAGLNGLNSFFARFMTIPALSENFLPQALGFFRLRAFISALPKAILSVFNFFRDLAVGRERLSTSFI